jgi:hypothetical protein
MYQPTLSLVLMRGEFVEDALRGDGRGPFERTFWHIGECGPVDPDQLEHIVGE